jgi:antitoxin component YwqK of YwqJK toxin-antitoxin module
MKKVLLVCAAIMLAGCSEEKSTGDPKIDQALKVAIDIESLQYRDGLICHNNEPYSGWGKEMYDSGQVKGLGQFKDGKLDGLMTSWQDNGQKLSEGTYKDGKEDGLFT